VADAQPRLRQINHLQLEAFENHNLLFPCGLVDL
jgi:hypothetical protein